MLLTVRLDVGRLNSVLHSVSNAVLDLQLTTTSFQVITLEHSCCSQHLETIYIVFEPFHLITGPKSLWKVMKMGERVVQRC